VSLHDHTTTNSICGATISSKTRLVLEEVNPKISEGMYVTIPMGGSGIPHETKVTRVDNDVITLSAASSITIGDVVRFDANTAGIHPFTLTIPAGGTLGPELIASDAANNRTFDSSYGNWAVLDTTGSNVSIARGSDGKLQVNTSTDNEIEGTQLGEEHVGNGSSTSIVTGQVYRVSMDIQLLIPDSGTMSMRMGIGGGLSSAFDITTTETTYTQDITAANTTGHLLIYNTSATATTFKIDNISVKRIQYKNLGAISEASASYLPNRALAGSSGLQIVTTTTSTSTDEIVLQTGDIGKCAIGDVVQGSTTFHNGNRYVPITAVSISTNTITVASTQNMPGREKLTVFADPDLEIPVTSSGVDLFHIHAAVTTDGGSVNSQEIATVYGYAEVNRLSNSATLPLYIENLLTSASY
jgi:hypothetical protein